MSFYYFFIQCYVICDILCDHLNIHSVSSDVIRIFSKIFEVYTRVWYVILFHNHICIFHNLIFGHDRQYMMAQIWVIFYNITLCLLFSSDLWHNRLWWVASHWCPELWGHLCKLSSRNRFWWRWSRISRGSLSTGFEISDRSTPPLRSSLSRILKKWIKCHYVIKPVIM